MAAAWKHGKKPETQLVKACLQYLNARGIMAWRNNTGAIKTGNRLVRFGDVGSPDILGILPTGQALCVECKVGKNELSEHQESWLKKAKDNKAKVLCVYSLEQLMNEMGEQYPEWEHRES